MQYAYVSTKCTVLLRLLLIVFVQTIFITKCNRFIISTSMNNTYLHEQLVADGASIFDDFISQLDDKGNIIRNIDADVPFDINDDLMTT